MISTNCCPGGISEYAVHRQDEVGNRITTCSAGECVSVSASRIELGSVPGIRQLVCTYSCSCSISQYTVYRQDEVGNRIATGSACEGVSVSASGIDVCAIPCVRQLVGTDGGTCSISEYAIYSQDEVDNRIATSSTGEGVPISASGVNVRAVPTVWQLVRTNDCPGCIA